MYLKNMLVRYLERMISYTDATRRITQLILCCDGTLVGESVGFVLNQDYANIVDIRCALSERNKDILLSILRMDFDVREGLCPIELIIYPKSCATHAMVQWDCCYLHCYGTEKAAIRGSTLDIEYMIMKTSSLACYEGGSYHMRVRAQTIPCMINRMKSKRFCFSYPCIMTTQNLMKCMSLIRRGWCMDDVVIPGNEIVLAKQGMSCSICSVPIGGEEHVYKNNGIHRCVCCMTARGSVHR